MADAQLPYLTVAEAAALIAARKLSPVELVRATLDRYGALSHLNAYLTLMENLGARCGASCGGGYEWPGLIAVRCTAFRLD